MKLFRNMLAIAVLTTSICNAQEATTNRIYEFASFSSMGSKSYILYKDGTIIRLADKYKRPGSTNEKMYYETMAFNLLYSEGFEVFSKGGTPMFALPGQVADQEDDVLFVKIITK